MRNRMCFDDVAWEKSDAIQNAWVHDLFKEETLMAIGKFILKHRRGKAVELCDPKAGAFNVSFRMKYEDGGSVMIRFPKPGATMFPDEKVRNEVAVMRYIHQHTSIPVPFILHWGTKIEEENPLGLGPFIIMEYIDHVMDLSDALNTPGFTRNDRPILGPNIDTAKLELLYGQFADILLQLPTLRLPRIGSLVQIDDFTWEVNQRPLSFNANELVRLGTLPRSKLPKPNETFPSASSYFDSLANLYLEHLIHQRNDAVDSPDDCRRKYIARLLFRKLAKEGRFTTSSSSTDLGPFNIWYDDLRPSNVLLNENLQIWLLLEQPEYWPDGLDAWTNIYESRLQTFLKVLQEREEEAIDRGRLEDGQRLSRHMQQSWESGDFWVTYAARKNFAFDAVFWKNLDARFFGLGMSTEDERWKDRLELLTENEREDMEKVVEKKLDQTKTRVLAWEPDE